MSGRALSETICTKSSSGTTFLTGISHIFGVVQNNTQLKSQKTHNHIRGQWNDGSY